VKPVLLWPNLLTLAGQIRRFVTGNIFKFPQDKYSSETLDLSS